MKNNLRFAAHIFFGLCLGISIGQIGLSGKWVTAEYFGFVAVFGFLLSALAEFAQAWHYTNVRPHEPNSYQWLDVLKNSVSCIVGGLLLFLFPQLFIYGIVGLSLVVFYALVQVVRKEPI